MSRQSGERCVYFIPPEGKSLKTVSSLPYKDFNQTAQLCSLIEVFARLKIHNVHFFTVLSNFNYTPRKLCL